MNPLPWLLGGGWKWLALGALALYVVALKVALGNANDRADAARTKFEQTSAQLQLQSEAVRQLQIVSQRKTAEARRLRLRAEQNTARMAPIIRNLESARPQLTADCPTPPEVMKAEPFFSSTTQIGVSQ